MVWDRKKARADLMKEIMSKPAQRVLNPKKVSVPVKKAIKRAINTAIETKISTKQIWQQNVVQGAGLDPGSGLGLTTTGISGAPSTILPSLPSGNGDANRDGDIVNPKRLVLKFSLRALDTTGNVTGTNPFRGKPMLCRVIIFNKRYAIDDYSPAGILDKGNTVGNLDSSPDSWLEPYNKKDFRIFYSKTFKLCAFSDTGTTPPTLENIPNGYVNYIAKKVSLKLPKKLYFAKTADTDPQNSSMKMSIAVCNVDGSVVGNTQFRVQVNAESALYYTDA